MRFTLVLLLTGFAPTCFAQVLVQSNLVQDHYGSPGSQHEGFLAVINPTDQDRRVRVYVTDYQFWADGTTDYGAPGDDPRSAADWIAIGAPEVIVPAAGTIDIRYAVEVPSDRELTGTWWCALMVEDGGSVTAEDRGTGLSRRVRFASQIVVRLGSEAPELEFEDLNLIRLEESSPVLQIDLSNAGGDLADTEVTLELFDDAGTSRGRIPCGRARLYPDTSYRFAVDLGHVPEGRYNALVIVDTGDENGVGSQFVLEL